MIDLYFAGCGYKEVDYILQSLRLNRLMSYLQPSKKLWIEMGEELMDIYFVGPRCKKSNTEMFKLNKNFLCSFENNSLKSVLKIFKEVKPKSKFFVDSGAFTTWTKGKEIDVDKYLEWLNENDKSLTIFGQVDCIPGKPGKTLSQFEREEASIKTFENYMYMIRRLASPEKCLFTFHLGENFEYLREFLNNKILIEEKEFKPSYMALGGLVGAPEVEKERFIEECFDIIANSKNSEIKVHLFGVTQLSILEKFPKVASVDSTAWLMVAAMGSIMTENGSILISDVQKDSRKHCSGFMDNSLKERIERYGFTLKQLRDDAISRCLYNACFMEEQIKNIKFKPILKLNKLF